MGKRGKINDELPPVSSPMTCQVEIGEEIEEENRLAMQMIEELLNVNSGESGLFVVPSQVPL